LVGWVEKDRQREIYIREKNFEVTHAVLIGFCEILVSLWRKKREIIKLLPVLCYFL